MRLAAAKMTGEDSTEPPVAITVFISVNNCVITVLFTYDIYNIKEKICAPKKRHLHT